jgi:hypothetical protein
MVSLNYIQVFCCFNINIADDGRMLAANSRGSNVTLEMPEWKRNILGGHKASFGKKEKKSILEQRQSLPIYKLKDELIKVCFYFPLFGCCHISSDLVLFHQICHVQGQRQ